MTQNQSRLGKRGHQARCDGAIFHGNVVNDSLHSYSWDAMGRPAIIDAVGVTYDALGGTDLSGNTTSEYVFFAGRRIARRDSSGNVYDYFADQLGSTRVITNSTGTTCFDADYYPGVYPERSRRSGEMNHTNTCPQNYKFTGHERDSHLSPQAFS